MSELTEEKIKKYKSVSRVAGIMSRVGSVFAWIGMVGCIIGAVALTVITPNLKVNSEDKTISFFDMAKSYKIENNTVELGDDIKINLGDKEIDLINDFLEKDLNKYMIMATISLYVFAVLAALGALEAGHGASIFKNIADKETPFIEDNIERTHKIVKLMIAGIIISFVLNEYISIVTGNSFNVSSIFSSMITVFGAYTLEYVFKSGLEKQEKKK